MVLGASAGGVEALQHLFSQLPVLPAAFLVVLHTSPQGTSSLPEILSRAGPMPARHAVSGGGVEHGAVLVAPPNLHLELEGDRTRLVPGPRVNGHRPSVDVLFRSAAKSFGPRVIGIILTGARSDGTLGLRAVKAAGGYAITQADPLFPGMPESAADAVEVDEVVPLALLPGRLAELVRTRVTAIEAGSGKMNVTQPEPDDGNATGLTCPDCGGALWSVEDELGPGFRCHVGHVYSLDALAESQDDTVERALWAAVRALRERAGVLRRLARAAEGRRARRSAKRFAFRAAQAERQAAVLREFIEETGRGNPEASEDAAS